MDPVAPRSGLDWMDRGLCLQVGPDPFFPPLGALANDAKSVCRSCEVRVQCLDWALRNGDREGVFGGFTERPRRKIAREHRAGRPLEDIIAEDDARFYARLKVAS